MIIKWLLLLIIAFLPPIIYVIWIRNTERYYREPWKPILLCFLWGASIAAIASLILNTILGISLATSISDYTTFSLITAVVIAPIVEEFTKPLVIGLKTVKKELDEIEDGLIYGAAAGLGFSATENLFYESAFLSEGLVLFFILVVIRTIGGCLLHASATAFTGYGYSKSLIARKPLLSVAPYFILAIGVHAFYNLIASSDIIWGFIATIGALIFAIFSIRYIRKKIRKLDKRVNNAQQPSQKEVSQGGRRCPSCDHVIPFDANICPYCGKKFVEFQPDTVQDKCPYCGFEIKSGDIFCRKCGKKIEKR